MRKNPVFPLTIFYDGACLVCATEMRHYRQKNHGNRLLFVDISDPGFEAERYGMDIQEFMEQMHVIDANGAVYRGVDAFPPIWQALPESRYRFLAAFIRLPAIHAFSRLAYFLFARYRHYLPRREASCDADSCNLKHRH